MQQEHLDLDIDEVDFDHENPRIKMALEKYGDKINAKRIAFALKTASPDDSSSAASFNKLKGAIHAFGRIAQPVTVVERNGNKVCIDGNTRLAIYKEFDEHDSSGRWKKIPAILINNAEQLDIEKIRVSAHLVGAREWPAYEKARYLHYLYYEELLDPAQMVALCGGNEKEIRQSIEAFNDMNEYYRDKIEDETKFRIDRFSGFVEVQNARVQESIFGAGFDLGDFGQWIHEGQIHNLADVRQLPKILGDSEAQEIFVNGGIDSAGQARKFLEAKEFDRKKGNTAITEIQKASIEDLATTLTAKLGAIPYTEVKKLQEAFASTGEESTIAALQNLNDVILPLLDDIVGA